MDFAPFKAMMEPYFLPHRLRDAKVAYESTIIEKGNWKLVWENNRECYHCAGNHPELCKTFPEAPTVTGINGAKEDPEIAAHWEKCEAAGLPSAFVIDDRGQYRATRVPLLREAVSYTISGRKAVQMRLSDNVNMDRIGTLLMFHYPTTWNHVLSDHALSFRVLPLIGKFVAKDEASYRYLAESIRMHPDQETLLGMMRDAGLEDCRYHNLTGGIVAVHRGYRY
jgi:Rieske 2Fe-2S family protein